MAESIGSLHASMSAGHARFREDMGKARAALQTNSAKMRRSMQSVGRAFSSTLGKLKKLGAFAAAGGAAALTVLIKKSIDTADELSKMSASLGVSVETLSTLAHASELSGTSLKTLATGLRLLAKNAQDTAEGTGTAKDALAALDVQVLDSSGSLKGADILLKEIASRFSAMEDGALKTALAQQVFGRSGAELIPLLDAGADGIQNMQDRARELGLELDTNTALSAAEFNDRLTDLQGNLAGTSRTLVLKLLPALNQIAIAVNAVIESGGGISAVWGAFDEPFRLGRAQAALDKWRTSLSDLQKTQRGENGVFKRILASGTSTKDLRERVQYWEAEVARLTGLKEQRLADARAAAEAARQEAEQIQQTRSANTKATQERIRQLREEEAAKKEAERRQEAEAKRAQREAAARQQRGADAIQQLERERDLFEATTRVERVRWEMSKGTMANLSEAHKARILDLARELDMLDVLKEFDDGFKKDFAKTGDEVEGIFDEQLTQAVERWGARSTDALTDFVLSGKASFKDFADSVIRDLIRIELQKTIIQPLLSSLPGIDAMPGQSESRAGGGPVRAGGLYEVNERGPELLSMGNRQFLMMAQRGGQVHSMDEDGSPGSSAPPGVRIINVLDPSLIGDWLANPAGEKQIVNTISKHSAQLIPLMK